MPEMGGCLRDAGRPGREALAGTRLSLSRRRSRVRVSSSPPFFLKYLPEVLHFRLGTKRHILAYHGFDRSVAERLLSNKTFRLSENDYDWLGSGVYFGEANPARALAWARHLKKVGKSGPARIRQPYATGAVINLGYCLDLISTNGIEFVKEAYLDFKHYMEQSGSPMPTNRGGDDLLQRYLDCAVINHIHSVNKRDKGKAFDTVRGLFLGFCRSGQVPERRRYRV